MAPVAPSGNRKRMAALILAMAVVLAYFAYSSIYGYTGMHKKLTAQVIFALAKAASKFKQPVASPPTPTAQPNYQLPAINYPTENFLIDEDRVEAVQMQQYLNGNHHLLRAAICILVQARRIHMLRALLDSLHRNFNQRFPYPILLFHERDFLPHRQGLRKGRTAPLFFQMVQFKVPDFFTERFGSAESVRFCPWSGTLSYRHMCRFQYKAFYDQPALRGLEFYWRLDDDSLVVSPITVDLFKQLRDSEAEYGYLQTVMDSHLCTYDLWNSTRRFIAERRLRPTFFNQMPEDFVFFNNFEISRMRFWLSSEYRSFMEMIDQQGGVYRYRWGDAPIKTIGLSLFVRPEKIAKFTNIGYQHGNPNIPPRRQLKVLEQLSISGRAINSAPVQG